MITRVFARGWQEGENLWRRCDDTKLLALKTVAKLTSQRIQVAPKSWHRQGNGFSPRTIRRNSTLLIF